MTSKTNTGTMCTFEGLPETHRQVLLEEYHEIRNRVFNPASNDTGGVLTLETFINTVGLVVFEPTVEGERPVLSTTFQNRALYRCALLVAFLVTENVSSNTRRLLLLASQTKSDVAANGDAAAAIAKASHILSTIASLIQR
jgi:hypothetical protein